MNSSQPTTSTRPRRSPKPIQRYQDETFVPGSNNGHTAGRSIDSVDFGFDPAHRGSPGFQPRGVALLPTGYELEEDERLAGVDYETESEAESSEGESSEEEWEPSDEEDDEYECRDHEYERENYGFRLLGRVQGESHEVPGASEETEKEEDSSDSAWEPSDDESSDGESSDGESSDDTPKYVSSAWESPPSPRPNEDTGHFVINAHCHYVGERCCGLANGKGTFTCRPLGQFIGDFRKGKFHGKGVWLYPNGDRYEGEVKKNGKRHGRGKMTYANRDSFEGTWDTDERCYGTYTWADGTEMTGVITEAIHH